MVIAVGWDSIRLYDSKRLISSLFKSNLTRVLLNSFCIMIFCYSNIAQ